jgi:hypothetical protein
MILMILKWFDWTTVLVPAWIVGRYRL